MKPFQFRIGTLMKIILLVALVAAASRMMAPPEWLLYVPVGSMGLGVVLMMALTKGPELRAQYLMRHPNRDPNRQRQALLGIATSPWNLSGRARNLALALLAELEKREQNFEAAAEHYRAILKRRLPHGREAFWHLELAHCLDRLGRDAEANQQRELADECLDNEPSDFFGWFSQGKVLHDGERYAEACEAFEQALEHLPAGLEPLRPQVLMNLVLSAHDAGRIRESAEWCEACLATKDAGPRRLIAHRMAGVAYDNLGALDFAEQHRRAAYDLAVESGDPKAIADCLAQLADLKFKRGNLVEAEQDCLRAAALGAPANRDAFVTRAEILNLWGRFEEAIDCFLEASRAEPLVVPDAERRSQAMLSFGMAWTAAEARDAARVRAHLEKANAAFASDPRLGLWCRTMSGLLAAMEGHAEESARVESEILAALPAFDDDRTTQLGTLYCLARAALARSDFARAESLLMRYRDRGPNPVSQPTLFYHLGLSRWEQDDHPGARDWFEQADATGLDTHYARLARRMLAGAMKVVP
jgi:tetratricopeptide (TPR) repeat protein